MTPPITSSDNESSRSGGSSGSESNFLQPEVEMQTSLNVKTCLQSVGYLNVNMKILEILL